MEKDWIGIEKAKRFFSGKDFSWFEKKRIKDEEKLSDEDKRWLRGWTLAPLGVANIFYLGSKHRKLYDILFVSIFSYIYFEVNDLLIRPLFISGAHQYKLGVLSAFIYSLITLFLWVASAYYGFYFGLRHGKRLSWNRGDWNSVEELRVSEEKWFKYNFLLSISILGAALIVIYSL